MEEILEIVLRAIDDASSIFSSVSSSAEEMGTSIQDSTTESTTGFEDMETAAEGASGGIQDIIDYCSQMDNGTGPRGTADAMDELEQETREADEAIKDLGGDLDIINSSMMLQTAEQLGAIGDKAEGMAQDMNTAAISVGQLSTVTGIAEPQMVSLINNISNATFPQEEAMQYVYALKQMGIESSNYASSATNMDRINDALQIGSSNVVSLSNEMSVLGVDMNHVETSFNALAYANSNAVGGMENYQRFLTRYSSDFAELGMNIDQASVALVGATQKWGGGRAAVNNLSKALESCNGDLGALEKELGLQAGSLTNATQLTGQYEGQLQELASEEAEHKTLLEQIGAAWEDFSLAMSGVLAPLGSAVGLIGQAGSFAMQINGLVTLSGTLKGVVGTLREFNLVQAVTNALEGEGAVARVASALGIVTETAAAEGATVAFGGLAIAEGAALWPILAIIAAIGLLVAAVYEIGKAFSWWSDVGSMLDAIWAGIQRLWSAFVNHPDVQAAISAVTWALQALWGAIQQAGQAVLDFFGVNSSGNFDIVRALIDAIGVAWQAITLPIRTVISVLQMVWNASNTASNAMSGFWNDTLVPFGEWLSGFFAPVWQVIIDAWNYLVEAFQPVVEVFEEFMQGQTDLGDVVMTTLSTLWGLFLSFNANLSSLILGLAGNLWNWAVTAGMNFLNGIGAYLSQVATNVFNYLNNARLMIIAQLLAWVTLAKQKASQFVTGIITFISQLPGRVYNYLLSVVSRIISAGSQWVSNARNKASEVVNGAANTLSQLPGRIAGALGGVTDAIVKPFRDAYDQAKKLWDDIVAMATNTPGPQGGDSAYGGDSAWGGDEPVPVNYSNSGEMTVTENVNVTLDFKNVPSHLDTDTLVSALTDKSVLRALVGNRDFQSLDAKVKGQLVARDKRYNGV